MAKPKTTTKPKPPAKPAKPKKKPVKPVKTLFESKPLSTAERFYIREHLLAMPEADIASDLGRTNDEVADFIRELQGSKKPNETLFDTSKQGAVVMTGSQSSADDTIRNGENKAWQNRYGKNIAKAH